MTSGGTSTSSRSPIRTEVEVDSEGRARCPDCGEFAVETMVSPLTGSMIRRGPCCENCQRKRVEAEKAKEKERALAQARYRWENIETLMGRAGVSKRYLGCSLDNYKGKVSDRRPAFITGPPGIGKTHLAVAYLREDLLAHGEEHCRFIRTVDLLKAIRDSFDDRSGDSEKRLLDYYGALPGPHYRPDGNRPGGGRGPGRGHGPDAGGEAPLGHRRGRARQAITPDAKRCGGGARSGFHKRLPLPL